MRICLSFITLLLLSIQSFSFFFFIIAECRIHPHPHRIILSHLSNAQLNYEEKQVADRGYRSSSGSSASSKFFYNPITKRLLGAIDHEDYGDPKAPPGMPQAQRGPVVFNRKRKGPKLPPSTKT